MACATIDLKSNENPLYLQVGSTAANSANTMNRTLSEPTITISQVSAAAPVSWLILLAL